MKKDADPVRAGEDPTQAILSESGLSSKHLCDYVINVATGCRHGCKFCYVPSTPNIRTRPDMLKEELDVDDPQREWGQYVLYRDDLPERLEGILERKQTWKRSKFGQGIVGISFGTDCYMDGRAGAITRDVVKHLSNHERYARILTRNPILALQDLDVFKEAGEYVTIGSSIPSLDSDEVGAIETRAPSPEHRLRGLKQFSDHGIRTYVSMSPTYPTMEPEEFETLLRELKRCDPDVIFHEPINPRGANFEMTVRAAREAGETRLAEKLDELRDREKWVSYAVKQFQWVQQIGNEHGLAVHLWPDKQLIKYADSSTAAWLQSWRDRQSPESFADRPSPSSNPPKFPEGRGDRPQPLRH